MPTTGQDARAFLFLSLWLCILGGGRRVHTAGPETNAYAPSLWDVHVVDTLESDKDAFVQGFTMLNGTGYISTGLWKKSTLRAVDIHRNYLIRGIHQPDRVFSEGIAILNDEIYQLTYKNDFAYVYGLGNFSLLRMISYPVSGPKEGWGLTSNNVDTLYCSDGSETLFVMDRDLHLLRRLLVHYVSGGARVPVHGLNELEWINGEIWGNLYGTDCIVAIAPNTGRITKYIVSKGLYPNNPYPGLTVMNGVAHDAKSGKIYLTGKMWPMIYEVTVAKRNMRFSAQRIARVCQEHHLTAAAALKTSELIDGWGT